MAQMKNTSGGEMSSIPCTKQTRRLVQGQKRGGATYDRVLQEMVYQFDPTEVDW